MKVTKKDKGKKKELSYPCLKIHEDGTVILFTDTATGIVLYSPKKDSNFLGQYEDDWCEETFKEYQGQLILEN